MRERTYLHAFQGYTTFTVRCPHNAYKCILEWQLCSIKEQFFRRLQLRTAQFSIGGQVETVTQERMVSVMSAILFTAAVIGLGYSCESQAHITSCSQGVQQTSWCLLTPKCSHNAPPHSSCPEVHCYIETLLVKEASVLSRNLGADNQTGRRIFQPPMPL